MKHKFLQFFLQRLAKMYLRRYHPHIVAVTGNVGKTSTKGAIATVLSYEKKVRATGGNLNNDLGVPLTIIGDWADEYYKTGGSKSFWLKVMVMGFLGLIVSRDYPEILVLEYGADKPGDIARLSRQFKPHVGVVTAVGEIPVHVEFFSGPEEVAKEKSQLIKALTALDTAILNFDDTSVLAMRDKSKAKVITFGFEDGADFRVSNFDIQQDEGGVPLGIMFKINHGVGFTPIKVPGVLGKPRAYAVAAAAAVGSMFGINLVAVNAALASFEGPKGRLKILPGIRNSWIIDDTYNAAPASTMVALETVKGLHAKRKVLVLGDMLELGKYSIQAHEAAGTLAASFANTLVCVGEKAKSIAQAAQDQMSQENIYTFGTSDEAKAKVRELIQKGDLILVKGSQGMRMEKIIEEIMAEPERAGELLVRQSKKWKNT